MTLLPKVLVSVNLVYLGQWHSFPMLAKMLSDRSWDSGLKIKRRSPRWADILPYHSFKTRAGQSEDSERRDRFSSCRTSHPRCKSANDSNRWLIHPRLLSKRVASVLVIGKRCLRAAAVERRMTNSVPR